MSDLLISRLIGTFKDNFRIGSKVLKSTTNDLEVRNASDDSLARIRASGLVIPSGAATGYVLTSDANGNGSWSAPSGGGGGGGGSITTESFDAVVTVHIEDHVIAADGDWLDVDFIAAWNQYEKIIIECEDCVASTSAATGVWMFMNVNEDSVATNYRNIRFTSGGNGATDNNYAGVCHTLTSLADTKSYWRIEVERPFDTAHTKNFFMTYYERRASSTQAIGFYYINWENTAAINRIQVYPHDTSTGFVAGTTFKIFGVKRSTVISEITGGEVGPPGPAGPAGPGTFIVQHRHAPAPGAYSTAKRIRTTRLIVDTILPTLLSKALTEKAASSSKTDFMGRMMSLYGSLASSPGNLVFSQNDRPIFSTMGYSNNYEGFSASIYDEDSSTISTQADTTFWNDLRQEIYNIVSFDGSITESGRYILALNMTTGNEASVAVGDLLYGMDINFLNYAMPFAMNASDSATGLNPAVRISWNYLVELDGFVPTYPLTSFTPTNSGGITRNPGYYTEVLQGYVSIGSSQFSTNWYMLTLEFDYDVTVKRSWLEAGITGGSNGRISRIRYLNASSSQIVSLSSNPGTGITTKEITTSYDNVRFVEFYTYAKWDYGGNSIRAFEIDYVY